MSDRLDRIEDKIDRLTDVIVDLARMEERQLDMQESIKRLWRKQDQQDVGLRYLDEKKIRPLEDKVAARAWVERVVWVIVVIAIGVALK